MEIAFVFVIVVGFFLTLALYNFQLGILAAVFFYALYPRFLSLGIGAEGFALTGQRAMLLILAFLYVLRALWGSAEIAHGIKILRQYRAITLSLAIFLAARLGGNGVTGWIDMGAIG